MSKGLLFWILMLLWLVLGLYGSWYGGRYVMAGGTFLLFILFGLVGWKVFGPPIQG